MKTNKFWAGLFLGLTAFLSNIAAQGTAAPLTIRLQPYLSGLSSPVFVTSARDGTNRLFIVEQGGIIKVVQPGSNAPTNFLNITSKISFSGERGLLGLAFHPQYAANRRFFVYYTRTSDGAVQIAEYQTSAANPNVADPTEKIIITVPHPTYANHNGGTIAFGPDGYLYAGTGDGGSANDPNGNAQNVNQLLGKILRLDINVPNGATQPYLIPPTNPFAGATVGADEIYMVGMRNPYRFSFDRKGTNQLWIADVGQGALEEVDVGTLGGNYGWRVYEGNQCTGLDNALCNPANFVPPVFQYNHTAGRCSITGGAIYRGGQNALPNGGYSFADYCTGEIFVWANNQQTLLLDTSENIVAVGEDEAGEQYVVGLGGTVQKIVRAKASADFDGDLKTDFTVYRPSNNVWYKLNSSNNSVSIQSFGAGGDIPTPEDFDGDNRADIAVFRPSTGIWYFLRSGDNTFGAVSFGADGDIPAAADYDGDAKADFVVYRPSNGVWYRSNSSDNAFVAASFGIAEDKPAVGDFDGDGRADISVYRPSTKIWYRLNSSSGAFSAVGFGATDDVPVQGDFDGDGKTDIAVFRPSNGVFYQLRSSSGFQAVSWGTNGDVPVVGDYDADGKDDVAVWRETGGNWYVLKSSNGAFQAVSFGAAGDTPIR